MVKKHDFLLVFLCILILSFLCGCSRNAAKRSRNEITDNETIHIGFSVATDTYILERWNKDIKIFTSAAKELGAEVLVQISAGGTKAQIDQIRYLLDKDIDILVVLPHDTSMIAGVIKEVNDHKIPVIAYDRLIQGVPIKAYVSFDNVEVGRLFGKALVREVPRGKYLIVNGSVRDNNSYLVNQGLHEIIDPLIKAGVISIVDELWLDQWSSDEATAKISEVLERTTDIDAISAGNDQLANAAIQLLAERRMAGTVPVVGQDADLLSCQRVVEGLQLMTVYKPIEKLASKAAYVTVQIAKGTMPTPDRYSENGSGVEIPYYVEMPKAVFKENMNETIIRDGFHSVEDVYREWEDEN